MKIINKPKIVVEIIELVLFVLPGSAGCIWLLSNWYCWLVAKKYLGKEVTNKYWFRTLLGLTVYLFVIIIFPLSLFNNSQPDTQLNSIITTIYAIIATWPCSLWMLWYQRKKIIDRMLEEKERRKQEK